MARAVPALGDSSPERARRNSGSEACAAAQSFRLAPETLFDSDKKIKIAEITLDSNSKLSCGDIRQFGGGEISSDNYEMIDSSSIKGRPYRVGSTMIIRLPKRFKAYQDILENEIAKHTASADYPILVFE